MTPKKNVLIPTLILVALLVVVGYLVVTWTIDCPYHGSQAVPPETLILGAVPEVEGDDLKITITLSSTSFDPDEDGTYKASHVGVKSSVTVKALYSDSTAKKQSFPIPRDPYIDELNEGGPTHFPVRMKNTAMPDSLVIVASPFFSHSLFKTGRHTTVEAFDVP